MDVAFEDLPAYRGRVAMVDGAFDPLHVGHLTYFEAAAGLGVPVLCNIAPDKYVEGKHFPFLPQKERAQLIDSLKPISFVHINPFDTETVLKKLEPKYYVKGKDWEGRLPEGQIAICKEAGAEIVYLDTVRDSSSAVLSRFLSHHGVENSLESEHVGWAAPTLSKGGHSPPYKMITVPHSRRLSCCAARRTRRTSPLRTTA